jgi:hypothetical protein
MTVQEPETLQPRNKPPSDPQVMLSPCWSTSLKGMPGAQVSVGHFDSAEAWRGHGVLFVTVTEQSLPPLSPDMICEAPTIDSDAAPNRRGLRSPAARGGRRLLSRLTL